MALHRSAINKGTSTGQFVAFGYNSVDNRPIRLGGFADFDQAEQTARSSRYIHKGIAKVTHPQKIWFFRGNLVDLTKVPDDLVLEIITLLGV